MVGVDLVDEAPAAVAALVEFDGALAVAAVPEAGVAFIAVGGFVVDEVHVGFAAGDVDDHFSTEGGLNDVPNDVGVGFAAIEVGAAAGPEFAEVEFVVLAFVVELAEEFAIKCDAEGFRCAAANFEDAVVQAFAGGFADEIIGRKPDPWRGEVAAPVFVGVAVAVFRAHNVLFAVQAQPAFESSFHAFGVPEHFKGVEAAKEGRRAVADVVSHLLVDAQVPCHGANVAHPFRVRLGVRFRDGDAPGHVRFGTGAVASGEVERHTVADADLRPGKEAMELPLWLTPEANVDHAIGRAAPSFTPGWIVPDKHGLRLSMGRIAKKVFDVEALRFAGLGVVGREGMPPPVVAFFRQRAFEHVGIACDVAFVHVASSFGECRLRSAVSYFPVYAIIRVKPVFRNAFSAFENRLCGISDQFQKPGC